MALEIRIASYKNTEKTVSKFELMKQLPNIKDIDWIKDVPSQSLQNAVERLDISYKNFFRTCHNGGGFPKFANKRKYQSILFKEVKVLDNHKIKLPKIGELKLFKDSPILGIPKLATIKKEPTGYFVCIVCDEICKTIQNPDENQVCGVDMGVTYFCVDSNGNFIDNPKFFKQYERQLRIENRSLARKTRGSNRWKKQAKRLALLHHKIANARKDFLHKESTKLAKQYNIVYMEDLKIKNMTKRSAVKQDENGTYLKNNQSSKSGLNKSILDCGWGMFKDMLKYKTKVVLVSPKYTSQTCNECGCIDAVNRVSQSEFVCTSCGNVTNADLNASKNIMSKGIAFNRKRETEVCALVEEFNQSNL
jgi:putative transposase